MPDLPLTNSTDQWESPCEGVLLGNHQSLLRKLNRALHMSTGSQWIDSCVFNHITLAVNFGGERLVSTAAGMERLPFLVAGLHVAEVQGKGRGLLAGEAACAGDLLLLEIAAVSAPVHARPEEGHEEGEAGVRTAAELVCRTLELGRVGLLKDLEPKAWPCSATPLEAELVRGCALVRHMATSSG